MFVAIWSRIRISQKEPNFCTTGFSMLNLSEQAPETCATHPQQREKILNFDPFPIHNVLSVSMIGCMYNVMTYPIWSRFVFWLSPQVTTLKLWNRRWRYLNIGSLYWTSPENTKWLSLQQSKLLRFSKECHDCWHRSLPFPSKSTWPQQVLHLNRRCPGSTFWAWYKKCSNSMYR